MLLGTLDHLPFLRLTPFASVTHGVLACPMTSVVYLNQHPEFRLGRYSTAPSLAYLDQHPKFRLGRYSTALLYRHVLKTSLLLVYCTSLPFSFTGNLEEALKLRFKQEFHIFARERWFDRLKQEEGRSVTKWYARVRDSAAECNFKDIEERVKDKFVTGMKQGPVYERLCEENIAKNLSDLIEIALNKESVLKERATVIKFHKIDKKIYK
ncbi:hypothetical protein ACJJTC_007221 [Scirpophaga incertulas]